MIQSVALPNPITLFLYRFCLTVKAHWQSLKPAVCVFTALSSRKELCVYLAEDDDDESELFSHALEFVLPTAKVHVMGDGAGLIKTLTKKQASLPDVIFLDINMPYKNGYECLCEIRSHADLKDIPIIIYSGSTAPSTIQTCFNLGATLYLPKPETLPQLRKLLKQLLLTDESDLTQPTKETFVLSTNKIRW
jgi:CheY-like chemotaxis protein